MKAKLIEITAKMTGNTELAEAIMENFNSINDMAEKREALILERISSVQNTIDVFKRDNKTDHVSLNNKIDLLAQNMNKLLTRYDIKPDKELLTEKKP